MVQSERRKKRSDDPVTALHYALALARAAGQLDTVVLVDESGCLIAGAGAWPACEELAAYAPLFARPSEVSSAAVGTRIAALEGEVRVHTVDLGGEGALLCGRGGQGSGEHLLRAADACRRILSHADA